MSKTIATGTWLRSNTMVQDTGPLNERVAEAGQVGRVMRQENRAPDGRPETVYEVLFHPSNITAYFTDAEIEADADVLEPDDDSIPAPAQMSAMAAVGAVFENGDVDLLDEVVRISGETLDRLKAALADIAEGERSASAIYAADASEADGIVSLSFRCVDEIAELAGVADRVTPAQTLAHARAM